MYRNKIFVRTAKAERKGAKLATDLKRLLSLLDGKTNAGELARRAPPSLRRNWDELLSELHKGEYIVDIPEVVEVRKIAPTELNPLWKGQVEARVNTARVPQAPPSLVSTQPTTAALNKTTTPVVDADETEAKRKAEKAARTAELKAYFAAAKEKAKMEAKQAAQEAERARSELEAAAAAAKISSETENKAKAQAQKRVEEAERARAELEAAVAAAKTRSATLARAKAEAKQRDQEAERARAELEAATAASKLKFEAKAKLKADLKRIPAPEIPIAKPEKKQVTGPDRSYKWRANSWVMNANEVARLRSLEIENEALKKLLTEAYVEIASLKASH
jgi:hypothetical protein